MDELAVFEYDRVRPLFESIDYQRPAVFPYWKARRQDGCSSTGAINRRWR
jgi:hypothetical protein